MDDRLSFWFDEPHQPLGHVPVRLLVEDNVFYDYNAYDRVRNHLAYLGFAHVIMAKYDPEEKVDTCLYIHDIAHEFAEISSGKWTTFYSHQYKAVVFCFCEERDAFALRMFLG